MSSDSEEYILILPRTYFGSSWNPEIFLFSVFFVSYKNALIRAKFSNDFYEIPVSKPTKWA
jgi:hypothetical protein